MDIDDIETQFMGIYGLFEVITISSMCSNRIDPKFIQIKNCVSFCFHFVFGIIHFIRLFLYIFIADQFFPIFTAFETYNFSYCLIFSFLLIFLSRAFSLVFLRWLKPIFFYSLWNNKKWNFKCKMKQCSCFVIHKKNASILL